MKCLIPVTQEMRGPNALKRAKTICDDMEILYVVDKKILNRMQKDSASFLNSDTLKSTEETILYAQKKWAEKISVSFRRLGKKSHSYFEVGYYPEVLERYVLRLRPQILMTDMFTRGLLSLDVPIWVDRGNEIKSILFVVSSISKINRMRRDFEIVRRISSILGCETKILYTGSDKAGIETLKLFGETTTEKAADLYCLQFFDKRYLKGSGSIVLLGRG